MAIPLTPDQILRALRAEGLTVVEVRSWRTHNRNHKGAWGPVHGIMFHHTAGGSSGAVDYCYSGSGELPGPLCHGVITKDGVVHLISAGRSNHAGGGDPNVLAAVKDERYGDRPPVPHQHQGTSGAVDGNAHFYGFECVNLGDGKDPWPAVQVDAMVRAGAALSRSHVWTAKSNIAHKEWSDYKPDPAGPGFPSMPDFRAKIAERLAHSPSWNPQAAEPTTPQGPDMTAPMFTFLSRAEDITLLQDIPYTVYWTGEHADTGNEHGDGGKTVLTGGTYSGVVNLVLDGLLHGNRVEVYPIEEDASGNFAGAGFVHEVYGQRDGTEVPARQVSVPLSGRVWNRLAIQIVSRSEATVVLRNAQLSVHHWNN